MDLDRYLSDPTALILDHLVLENGQSYGECAQPWQLEFWRAVFAQQPDGRPKFRLLYDERRRGESKTQDLAATALADLLTGPGRHHSYCVAADQDQAALILDSVRDFRARSAVLSGLEVGKNVVRNTHTDSELRVISSDDRTAFGIRPRKVFFDELSLQTDNTLWNAMWSSVGKSPKSQMVAVSMAGHDFSSVGWKVREIAAGSERYYFHSRQGSELAPWLSAEDLEEQRATLHPLDFATLWECRWVEAAGSFITREMYADAETGAEAVTGDPGVTYYGGVDLGWVHDATVLAICHADGDRVILDHLTTMQGSQSNEVLFAAVEDAVLELSGRFHVAHWTFESPQAVASVQRLKERLGAHHVDRRDPGAAVQADLWGTLYRLFSNRQLTVFPHERLRKEALNLVTRIVGGRLKAEGSSAVHQDHCVAVGIAAVQCVSKQKSSFTPSPVQGMTQRSVWLGEGQEVDSVALATAGSYANAMAPPPGSAVPDGTICGHVDRDGFVCGGTSWKSDGRCIRCDRQHPSVVRTGPGTPFPVLLLKSAAR